MYYQIDFNKPIRVFFCGIGGVSMSGLAEILKSRGFYVTGSDRAESDTTRHLESIGIPVHIGQKKENITADLDLVVFTAAIHPDNPEYQETLRLHLNHLTRAQVLGEVMRNYGCPVAISGTHGKTTTTSMISEILLAEDADPSISVGGNLKSIGGNVRVGHSDYFVAEACEYTNSFLSLFPKIGIILDIDADHLDFFKDLQDIRNSFRKFAQLIPADGTLIINSDIENLDEITDGLACRVVRYGSDPEKSDYWAEDITYDNLAHPTFTAVRRADGSRQKITLHVPGIHNVWNSLAAIACADLLSVDRDVTARALLGFTGTDRRFEFKGRLSCGTAVIDDYAHHPTEIAATLHAAKQLDADRIFVVFQPHTYTRTKALMDDFAKVLSLADVVILADIYAARETDTLGISSETLAEKIRALGHEETYYFPSFGEIEKFVLKNCRKNDVLITMGAGNVNTVAKDLLA
jgi:UDP-N-acetylmuramate--alanine ligase